MPAALLINWEAVRAHALLHGVRDAAAAFSLSPATVCARSAREGWLREAHAVVAGDPARVPASMRRGASGATKAGDAALSSLRKTGDKSRLNIARAVAKGAKHAAKLPPAEILAGASQLKALADTGARIHPEWAGASSAPTLRLELIAGAIGDSQGEALPIIDGRIDIRQVGDQAD